MVGLSGLITPSLEEMTLIAAEMQRRGFKIPLLIGGATTSPAHTAVKIDPQYEGPVVYVKDASRAVGVCRQLVTPDMKPGYVAEVKADNVRRREQHAGKKVKGAQLTLAQARANKPKIDWANYSPPVPRFLGSKVFTDIPLKELTPYIDWMPFFNAWEYGGTFPAVLDDPTRRRVGALLVQGCAERCWPPSCGSTGSPRARWWVSSPATRWTRKSRCTATSRVRACSIACIILRQQKQQAGRASRTTRSAISSRRSDSGKVDYIGAFAVTAGIGIEKHLERFIAEHDDYNDILLKSLADRLAEASAEALHLRVRRELWGYSPEERLTNEQLIAEQYRGIRPAPGYPACPDHTEKGTLWQMLDVERAIDLKITESFAMYPTAAVSGWWLPPTPKRATSTSARCDRDQVEDYARRKGMTVEEMERWLSPGLGYDPARKAPV